MVEELEFYTLEDLNEQLELRTGFQPARITDGKFLFSKKINSWIINKVKIENNLSWICIYPNPAFSLSFPYPYDEIQVPISLTQTNITTEEILKRFQLENELYKRQISSLSGGEIMLLNLAKAFAYKELVDELIICTPTQWLHPTRHELLNHLINSYNDQEKKVTLLFLEGEKISITETYKLRLSNYNNKDNIFWNLKCKDLEVKFEEQTFPYHSSEFSINYVLKQEDIELTSPTLLMGENGVGKSVFAKLMAGLYQVNNGKIKIASYGNEGKPRILLQKGISQLFGENIEAHFSRIFQYDKEKGNQAKLVYESFLDSFQEKIKNDEKLRTKKIFTNDSKQETILQIKFALISERIIAKPNLLILDEPDWCLSKRVTNIFTDVVIEICHKKKIPVAIITHQQSWYSKYTNSVLWFSKDSKGIVNIEKVKI